MSVVPRNAPKPLRVWSTSKNQTACAHLSAEPWQPHGKATGLPWCACGKKPEPNGTVMSDVRSLKRLHRLATRGPAFGRVEIAHRTLASLGENRKAARKHLLESSSLADAGIDGGHLHFPLASSADPIPTGMKQTEAICPRPFFEKARRLVRTPLHSGAHDTDYEFTALTPSEATGPDSQGTVHDLAEPSVASPQCARGGCIHSSSFCSPPKFGPGGCAMTLHGKRPR